MIQVVAFSHISGWIALKAREKLSMTLTVLPRDYR